jgi:cysteinyl-tRNA synthetase
MEIPPEVSALVAEREDARRAKDWKRADDLRRRTAELGYVIEDRPAGPLVKPAR